MGGNASYIASKLTSIYDVRFFHRQVNFVNKNPEQLPTELLEIQSKVDEYTQKKEMLVHSKSFDIFSKNNIILHLSEQANYYQANERNLVK